MARDKDVEYPTFNGTRCGERLIEHLSMFRREPIEDYYLQLLRARQCIDDALACAEADGVDLEEQRARM